MSMRRLLLLALGVLSCKGGPSEADRREQTSEARVQLKRMMDVAFVHYIDGNLCRAGNPSHGATGVTPPLSVNCAAGPSGQCVPSSSPDTGPGVYDSALWEADDLWSALDHRLTSAHRFHYSFAYAASGDDKETCNFTAQAFADLDDDGVFSTFTLVGTANTDEWSAPRSELSIEMEAE